MRWASAGFRRDGGVKRLEGALTTTSSSRNRRAARSSTSRVGTSIRPSPKTSPGGGTSRRPRSSNGLGARPFCPRAATFGAETPRTSPRSSTWYGRGSPHGSARGSSDTSGHDHAGGDDREEPEDWDGHLHRPPVGLGRPGTVGHGTAQRRGGLSDDLRRAPRGPPGHHDF